MPKEIRERRRSGGKGDLGEPEWRGRDGANRQRKATRLAETGSRGVAGLRQHPAGLPPGLGLQPACDTGHGRADAAGRRPTCTPAWVAKLIVDGVVSSMSRFTSQGLTRIATYLGLEFGLIFTGAVIGQLRSLAEHLLHSQLTNHEHPHHAPGVTLDLRFLRSPPISYRTPAARPTFGRCASSTTASSWCRMPSRSSPWPPCWCFSAPGWRWSSLAPPCPPSSPSPARLASRAITWRAPSPAPGPGRIADGARERQRGELCDLEEAFWAVTTPSSRNSTQELRGHRRAPHPGQSGLGVAPP